MPEVQGHPPPILTPSSPPSPHAPSSTENILGSSAPLRPPKCPSGAEDDRPPSHPPSRPHHPHYPIPPSLPFRWTYRRNRHRIPRAHLRRSSRRAASPRLRHRKRAEIFHGKDSTHGSRYCSNQLSCSTAWHDIVRKILTLAGKPALACVCQEVVRETDPLNPFPPLHHRLMICPCPHTYWWRKTTGSRRS